MINNLNISNLQVFNKEGSSLPCPGDLQEAMQLGIAKKVGKLLSAEGFLTLIPDFDPSKDIKLHIHLTKDRITIQLLERDLEDSKVDTSYTKKDPELSEEIKARKEKIIKKIDSLFKEPSSPDLSARLESEKIHPLFIPSQPSKDEQVPFKIGFDATVSNPQIQQLHTKIEGLQDQLNKKTPHSEELQAIKEQLQFLSQAILSFKQENITYPHTEEYALINKLVDNQRDVYRALLDLLSRNLNQTPTLPSIFQDTKIKEMPFESKENTSLEELIDLKKGIKELSNLQQEKDDLELEYKNLTEQITQAKEAQTQLDKDYTNKIKQIERSNTDLQINILDKDKQINELDKQIKNSGNTHQELEKQFSQLQQELLTLKQSSSLIDKNHKETSQLLENKQQEIIALQEKLGSLSQLPLQLSNLQKEKDNLELEYKKLKKQLDQASQNQLAFLESHQDENNKLNNKIANLQNEKASLQMQLSTKDEQISKLNEEAQHLFEAYQALESKDEKEMARILETINVPEISSEITSIDATIEKAKNTMEENFSSLENSTLPEGLLTPASNYYTLTAALSLEESLETSSEITLQEEINDLREELENIRPIAYDNTSRIEKMEKSNKTLALKLSKKTKTIEGLEKEKAVLESQLLQSELRLKDLQRVQHTFNEQQKEISISSEENNDLLKELEKIHEQLSLEKRKRAELEQTHENQLERLRALYNENTLEKMERINAKIINLQQEQKTICFTLTQAIADYMKSESGTEDIGQNIFKLVEKAFNTTGYKTLLDLVSSEEENLMSSSEESASSDEYNEDSYIEL